jgi:hypothetical protein
MMSGKTLNSVDTIDAEIKDNYDEPLQPCLHPRKLPQNTLLVENVRSLKLCPLLVRHDHATREERHRYGAQILASPIRQAKGTEPFYQNRF